MKDMDNREYHFHTPHNKHSNVNSRMSTPSPLQGWGTPARGYSPYTCNVARPYISPKNINDSPVNNKFQPWSPRLQRDQYKYHSPNEPRSFRSPQYMPYSPPGPPYSDSNRRYRGSPNQRGHGRKSFNKNFGKSPRPDCNPGASTNIENYYHPEMLEDPWKFCKPVAVTSDSWSNS